MMHDQRASATALSDVRAVWHPVQVTGTGEAEVARVCGLQHGVISRDQLLAAGIGRGGIAHRLGSGRLHRIHPAVYLVGRASPERLSAESAAVLLSRGAGVLSGRSAAYLADLAGPPETVTMTLIGANGRSRPGLTIHRTRALDRSEIRVRHRLPVTSPARTLLDLSAEASDSELLRALAQARFRHLVSEAELGSVLARARTRKGAGRLRALIGAEDGASESGNERRMFGLLKAAGLPSPVAQAPVHGYRVDFLWPAHRLIVEVDSYDFHGDRAAFESDRERDQALVAAGYRVIRVTARQLRDQPFAVIARLAGALTHPA